MFRSYLKVTFRNIIKHKGYSFINIAGLAIGLTCCMLITLWVLDELSYDKFHEKASYLYRVEENQDYSGRNYHVTVTPYPLGAALKEEVAEIKDSVRVVYPGSVLMRYGEKVFFESNVRAVDPSFFHMFSFPLLAGDRNSALEAPNSLVINEEIAEKYFGREDPLGRILTVNNQHEFTVTGVMQNFPHNSILQYDMLIPYEFLKKTGQANENFGSNSISTYVELQENVTMAQVNERIVGFIKSKVQRSSTDLELMPFTRIHLHAYFGYEKTAGAIQYVYIFSIIAAFILLIACINFMNLATARSANRAKEVGLRKVVGALKRHLVRQFYGESIVFALLSLLIAVLLATILLPAFGNLAGKELSWGVTGIGWILAGLAAITLFTGLVAGSYPALFLSSFQPVKVLKGSLKSGPGSALFRKVLVVIQFSLSILLIIGTTVVYKQLNYMKNKKLGWDKEHLVYIPLRADIRDSYKALKTELLKDSCILAVTGTSQLPSHIGSNSGGARWDGKDPDMSTLIGFNAVDFDFCKTLKIDMAEGRFFSEEYPADLSRTFIVNEEVARIMDKDSVVGERFSFVGVNGTIVGVMKNFHYEPVRETIEPLALIVVPQRINYMMIRIPPSDINASLQMIESTWNRVVPDYPFDYRFLDERFDEMYRAESKMGTLLRYFAVLAVFVACLGLFGLASFTAEQRTKEIGIRKVLGASVAQVSLLLCREFFLLVLLANLLAWPLAYYFMSKWLGGYAYSTGLGVAVFIVAMVLALVVAIISVSFQALRAALANPAEAIKYE